MVIRRAKRTAWQTFCSDIENTTNAARLRKILSKTAAPLTYLQKANGSWSDSSKESLDLLLDAHFPGSKQAGHPPERGAAEGIELDPLLSDRNMKWSIHSFKLYKSDRTGRDNTGSHPTSRTNSHKLVEKNLPIHPGGRRTTNSMAFPRQGRPLTPQQKILGQ